MQFGKKFDRIQLRIIDMKIFQFDMKIFVTSTKDSCYEELNRFTVNLIQILF